MPPREAVRGRLIALAGAGEPGGRFARPRLPYAPLAVPGSASLNARPMDQVRTTTTPLYLTLAKTLLESIHAGDYPVGSLLPTELELAHLHGVSRQTVRQAIAQLRQKNVLHPRKGVGTRVEGAAAPRPLGYSASSVADLLEMAQESELQVETTETVVARGALANALGCRSGHRWLHLAGPRTEIGEVRPFAWVNSYVNSRIAQQVAIPPVLRSALFQVIEKQTGNPIHDIQQEIRATLIAPEVAVRLEAEPRAPALEITRRYFSTGRRLVLVSISVMPADRFFYAVAIKPG
jgi:DNA-binding GntR family transcriptional regulator